MMTQKLRLRLAVLLIALCAAAPVMAQESFDGDCKIIPPESDRGTLIDVCRSHLFCDIPFRMQSGICKTSNFIDKLGKRLSDVGKIEAKDAVEASKPDGADDLTPAMRSHAATMTAAERARRDAEDHERQLRNTNAANDGPGFRPDETVLPPARPGGYVSIFEGSGNPKDGQGTLIGENGVTKGTFKNGKLEGEGEQILADGTYRGGNYKDGQIAGKGFEFGEKDGKSFVTEGTFKADQPDGIVTVTYEDKSSERVRWENGMIVSRGPRAKAGEVPDDPKPLTDVQLALATHAPTDYVIGDLQNGTGIIQRVRKDGTAQFEDWEDGKLMQVGVRAKKGDAISPQIRQKPTPHHEGGSGALPEEPRVARNPDPCAVERLGWAGHNQGAEAAKIFALEHKTSPSDVEPFLWELPAAQNLANRYRGQGVDPLHSPEFFREIAAMYHESAVKFENQAREGSVEDNRKFSYQRSRWLHAWVACMADFIADGSLKSHRNPTTSEQALQSANRERSLPDPCRNERMQWASYAQGPDRARIENATQADAQRELFLSKAEEVSGGSGLVADYRRRGVDATRDQNFLQQFTGIAHSQSASALQYAQSPAGQSNRGYSENAYGFVWVACMADKFARDLQTPRQAMTRAQEGLSQNTPRYAEDPNACNREWDAMFALVYPQNRQEYAPYAQSRNWRGFFLQEVGSGSYPANEVKERFRRGGLIPNLDDLVRDRAFLVAMRDTYRAHASAESDNPVGWYHVHDPFIACWADVEIHRVDAGRR